MAVPGTGSSLRASRSAKYVRQPWARVADGIGYLTQELRRLLAVVVVAYARLLTPVERQRELDAVLCLLSEVAATSPATQQDEVVQLTRRIRD